MKHLFLGIDLGTSAMKLVLIDEKKQVIAQHTEEYQAAQPAGGFSEIDPRIWFTCMEHGIRRILEGFDRNLLDGIGVTGQMHTLVVLDQQGEPVRPALMWNDTRTRDMIPDLKRRIAAFPEGDYLAKTISTGSPAANLYWLGIHEPENFKRIHKFLIGPDYLVYRLTGTYGTDYCEASTSCLYQIKKMQWSPEMRELIGLSEKMYPAVRGSAEAAGTLTGEVSDLFSLRRDVKVLVGTGDNPATAISTGCLGRGYPVISLGTSGVFMMPVCRIRDDAKGKIILFSFDGKKYSYLVQGAVQSNGSTFEWWVKNIMGVEDFSKVDCLIDMERAVGNEILFYPHLMGEKTLYADPDIRGAFIGLSTENDRRDMLYAVIEGLCFSFKELAEKMQLPLERFDGVKVVGGGSKSKVWMQTMANVLDIKIEQMDGMIGPAFGIALLAAYNQGCFSSPEQISEDTVKVKRCFLPEAEAVLTCEKKYKRYLKMHKGLQYIINNIDE